MKGQVETSASLSCVEMVTVPAGNVAGNVEGEISRFRDILILVSGLRRYGVGFSPCPRERDHEICMLLNHLMPDSASCCDPEASSSLVGPP